MSYLQNKTSPEVKDYEGTISETEAMEAIFGTMYPEGSENLSEKQITDMGDELEIWLSDKIEEPTAMLSVGGEIIATMGNFSVGGGKQKSRKTFFQNMLATAYLSGQWGSLSGYRTDNRPVLIFDCEQGKSHVYRVVKRLHRMLGIYTQHPELKVYYLREKSVDERVAIIQKQVTKHKPALVIIDGVVDICKDFNSIDESTKTVQLLMELSAITPCHIHTVLHENKASKDLRGHLGSIACQKAETVISMEKDGDITKVSPTHTRNKEFEEFYFRVDDYGLPCIIESQQISKAEVAANVMQEVMKSILIVNAMPYTKLVNEYIERKGCKEPTAKKHIADAIKMGIINKDGSGYYRWVSS